MLHYRWNVKYWLSGTKWTHFAVKYSYTTIHFQIYTPIQVLRKHGSALFLTILDFLESSVPLFTCSSCLVKGDVSFCSPCYLSCSQGTFGPRPCRNLQGTSSVPAGWPLRPEGWALCPSAPGSQSPSYSPHEPRPSGRSWPTSCRKRKRKREGETFCLLTFFHTFARLVHWIFSLCLQQEVVAKEVELSSTSGSEVGAPAPTVYMWKCLGWMCVNANLKLQKHFV